MGVNFTWILGEYDKMIILLFGFWGILLDVQGWQYTYGGNPYSSTSVVKSGIPKPTND